MLLYSTLAIVIISFTFVLHYCQHFRFSFWKYKLNLHRVSTKSGDFSGSPPNLPFDQTPNHVSKYSTSIRISLIRPKKQCHCKLVSSHDSELNFVPVLFLLYTIFMLFLCFVIVFIEMLNKYESDHTAFIIESHHSNSILSQHKLTTSNRKRLSISILEFTLIYGVMILSIAESLFTFYRYYTTFHTTVTLQIIPTTLVLKKFIIYPIVFCCLFVIQIQLYYWIWPAVIILYCSFNYYFTLKFASLLIKQYHAFNEMAHTVSKNVQDANLDILKSVYFMRRASLACCVIQSIYLSLFVITYNVNTIFYLPILWSLSCAIFGLNFIRNRITLQNIFIRCKQLKRKEIHTHKATNHNQNNLNIETTEITPNNTAIFQHRTNSWRQSHFGDVTDVRTNVELHNEPSLSSLSKSRGKALEILGIAQSASRKVQKLTTSKSNKSKFGTADTEEHPSFQNVKKAERPKTNTSLSKILQRKSISNPVLSQQLVSKESRKNLTCQQHLSAPTPASNHAVDIPPAAFTEKYNYDNSEMVYNSDIEQDDNNVITQITTTANCNQFEFDNAFELAESDGSDINSLTPIPNKGNDTIKNTNAINLIIENINAHETKYETNESEMKMSFDHIIVASNEIIENVEDERKNDKIAESWRSLNVLAKIGFCSAKHINSFDQIIKYNNKIMNSQNYMNSHSKTTRSYLTPTNTNALKPQLTRNRSKSNPDVLGTKMTPIVHSKNVSVTFCQ